jgi:hypothetical protein
MADDDQVCGVASVVEPSEEITEEATVGGQDEPEDGFSAAPGGVAVADGSAPDGAGGADDTGG